MFWKWSAKCQRSLVPSYLVGWYIRNGQDFLDNRLDSSMHTSHWVFPDPISEAVAARKQYVSVLSLPLAKKWYFLRISFFCMILICITLLISWNFAMSFRVYYSPKVLSKLFHKRVKTVQIFGPFGPYKEKLSEKLQFL